MALTAVAFLAIYIAGLSLAFARHPVFGLLTYELTFYLHPPGRWWGAALPEVRWSLLAAVVTLVAYLAYSHRVSSKTPFFSNGILRALFAFTLWLWVQVLWAVNVEIQIDLAVLFTKYLVMMFLIFRLINTPQRLRSFLWVHVAGCFIMGWVAFTTYTGGRFEGFAPPNVNEANAGALQLVTGVYTAAALFLYEKRWAKIVLLLAMPFLVNGIITTISRSGFLETAIGGFVFIFFSPPTKRKRVIALSVLAVVGFLYLTSGTYWNRIDTLKTAGVEVNDTGFGRVRIMKAQWRMFKDYPFGAGHRGTAFLSPFYLPDVALTGKGKNRARSSHNTFMTLLVEQGIFGVFFYLYLVWWTLRTLVNTRRLISENDPLLGLTVTALAAGLCAMFIGDLFVDYLKLEVRYWFIGLLIVLPQLLRLQGASDLSTKDCTATQHNERCL